MPYRSKQPCARPGCNVLVQHGYCDAHRPEPVPMSEDRKASKRLYDTAYWDKRRAAQLAAEPWCADCLRANIWTPATDVHHQTPHRGDAQIFRTSALVSLCHACHSTRTAEEGRSRRGQGGRKSFRGMDSERRCLLREKNSPIGTGI